MFDGQPHPPADAFRPLAPGTPLDRNVLDRLRRIVAGGLTTHINIHDATHLLDVLSRGDA